MCRFLTVCGFVQVACQGFLVREACVGVLLGGAVFLLSPFEELGCFSGCLMSSAGNQKLFCGIYSMFKCSFDEFVGEKVFFLSYSSAPCLTLYDPTDCSPPGSNHGDSPGKNTGVGSHSLLQGILPTQGSNLHLLHCRWIPSCLSHQGSA